jgi:muramidase (phage lysozyme)
MNRFDIALDVTPEDMLMEKEELFSDLSREAHLVCSIIIVCADDIPNITVGEITEVLRRLGWTWTKIRKTMKEIRQWMKRKHQLKNNLKMQ